METLAPSLGYANESGVPEDYVEAYKWFSLAVPGFPRSEAANRARAV
jgi:hypothetical protein